MFSNPSGWLRGGGSCSPGLADTSRSSSVSSCFEIPQDGQNGITIKDLLTKSGGKPLLQNEWIHFETDPLWLLRWDLEKRRESGTLDPRYEKETINQLKAAQSHKWSIYPKTQIIPFMPWYHQYGSKFDMFDPLLANYGYATTSSPEIFELRYLLARNRELDVMMERDRNGGLLDNELPKSFDPNDVD